MGMAAPSVNDPNILMQVLRLWSAVARPRFFAWQLLIARSAWQVASPKITNKSAYVKTVLTLLVVAAATLALGEDDVSVSLPDNVKAVWDVSKEFRETTPT